MKRNSSSSPFVGRSILLATSGMALLLAGCIGSEAPAPVAPPAGVTLNAPASITQVSADNYDDNVSGLITGNTLKRWIDNWSANRPAGITGKLVILQSTLGEAGIEYIKPNGTTVFTYKATEWSETRSNGVIETISMVPSGKAMDTFLAKYDINPSTDMIVCAQGAASASNAMSAGRCWYMFRYWGTPGRNLAQLNGGNQWNANNTTLAASYFSATGSTPPGTGTASVKDLPEMNFSLQATVEDMINIVPTQDVNLLGDGVFIWDARGNGTPGTNTNEYYPDDDTDHRAPPNLRVMQGHPNGALSLTYINLLNDCSAAPLGCTFKSKAEIQAYLNGETDTNGNGFIDATLLGVGSGRAYQSGDVVYTYCQTTYRAMVTGFATAAILGLPTRFYDGAMVEWNALSSVPVGANATAALPWSSPWRTDKATVSMFRIHSAPAGLPVPNIVNANAASANAIIEEDKAYKGFSVTTSTTADSGSSGTTSSGGGGVLPPNPCGG